MHVDIIDEQTALPLSAEAVASIVEHVILFEERTCDEVSIHFVDESTIRALHHTYFNDPSTTDCISFPLEPDAIPGYKNLGSVFVCPQTGLNYVRLHGGNVHEEITLYLVHGLLHLMGYDDVTEVDAHEMREAEARHIAELKKNGLILNPTKS